MRRLAELALIPFRRLMAGILWGLSTKHGTVHGVHIALEDTAAPADLLLSRVQSGLGLLEQTYPRWLDRTRRDVNRVLVHRLPGHRGLFQQGTKTVILARDFLPRPETIALHVASAFVHEATHAGLGARGISYGPTTRVRHEKASLRAELRFLASQPPSEDVIALRTALTRDLANADEIWSKETHTKRLRGVTAQLDLPPSIRGVIDRLGSWFHST